MEFLALRQGVKYEDERLKSPTLRGIEPPLANDLTRNFGAFFCYLTVFD